MTWIVQIAPAVAPGTGAEGVAYHLEREFRRAGAATERFTLAEARGGWLPAPGMGWRGKAALALRVVWFSTVGTVLARRYLAARPDAVAICHNDVLAGDIYVNHGILRAAMRARGRYAWRMVRNPLHLFTAARDTIRYAGRTHAVVVNLTEGERRLLRRTYRRLRPRPVVISNGVDTERFAPPTPAERAAARAALGLDDRAVVALFVGHEFERKGLGIALAALTMDDGAAHLVVVGGTLQMVAEAHEQAERLGVVRRVRFVGTQGDPRPSFRAADLLVLPSAYEANALVVLEALACGLPVLVTPVGYAPDLIVDGENGYLVDRTPEALAARLRDLASADLAPWRARARASAERHAWPLIAQEYLRLVEEIRAARGAR